MPFTYKYSRPSVCVDVAVFRKLRGVTEVLLIERSKAPFAGAWALPGGFLEMNETLEQAASRELLEETSVIAKKLIPVGTFSAVDRDPRGRVISAGFAVIVPARTEVKAGDDARNYHWFPIRKLPLLAFDHKYILAAAIKKVIRRV
jgi:8-oxo-dGTP diphosphatase